jgi:bifunctional DNA-binding transcriptional regulator/antitoxin component of YhaV-PrlF toxin-antitoxin module
MARLSSKNQVTIPVEVLRQAGLQPGDQLRLRAAGRGRVEIERWSDLVEEFAGSLPDGAYHSGYLDELRNSWDR